MYDFFGNLLGGVFGLISQEKTNLINQQLAREANVTNLRIARETNEANRDMTTQTNLANRQLVADQNQAAKEEAELAYQRSKPTTQVGNMMSSGMSLAGAINSLNGGGSYSPAPVNASRDEASRDEAAQVSPAMMESSAGLWSNIAQSFMQRAQLKHEEKLQAKQLDLERDKLQLERDKFQETANQNAALRNVWQNEVEYRNVQKRALEIQNEVNSALKQGSIDKGKAENLAAIARAQLDVVKDKLTKGGYDSLSENQVKSLIEYQVALEIMANFGDMTTTKIISYLHDIIDSLPFS